MLLIHKSQSRKKLFFLVITSICSIGALFGLSVLTYTPELSHAEQVDTNGLESITYMQEMTSEICAKTKYHVSKRLIDSRDNKKYWVIKAYDSNCWMTQNLDLDLFGVKLTPETSDVLETWTSSTGQSSLWSGSPMLPNLAKYFDPGLFIPPSQRTNCGTHADNITSLSQCLNSGWTNVSYITASDDPNFTGRLTQGDSVYNAHLLIGNYYSWGAATAGQAATFGGNMTYPAEATQSICPRGWTLPQNENTFTTGSYDTLLSIYSKRLDRAPLFFIYGGWINEGTINYAGDSVFYATATANGLQTLYALDLSFSQSVSVNVGRYDGFPIRCVARMNKNANYPKNPDINITITPTISLDVTNEVEVKKSDTNPSTAAFSALVASNQPYSVSISSTSPSLSSSTSSTTIPSKSGALTSNDNAWGIKLSTASTYEQITTTPKLFYSSSNPESKSLPFTIGISTAEDLPAGEYSTNITITATQN